MSPFVALSSGHIQELLSLKFLNVFLGRTFKGKFVLYPTEQQQQQQV
jgi:hypothetical protein